MEEKKTSQEWEIGVMEAVADGDELSLLEMAQACAVQLAAQLSNMKAIIWSDNRLSDMEREVLRLRLVRIAVMTDVLQLRYGD